MHQLHFKAEVRELKDLGGTVSNVTAAEVKLARQLIDHLAAKRFDPNEFVDEQRARVQAEIKKKIQGKEIALEKGAAPAPRTNVVSLMDALKASLQSQSAPSKRKTAKKAASPKRKTA